MNCYHMLAVYLRFRGVETLVMERCGHPTVRFRRRECGGCPRYVDTSIFANPFRFHSLTDDRLKTLSNQQVHRILARRRETAKQEFVRLLANWLKTT